MNWLEIQEKLNNLNEGYLQLENDKLFLKDEKNYETQRQKIDVGMFYFVKAIKNKINELPNSLDEVRNQIIALGNDTDKIGEYLNKLESNVRLCQIAMEVLRTILEISDKTYEYKDGYENSLTCKQQMDYMERCIEMMDRDDLTAEQKYEYADVFGKNLNNEDKGELMVQTLIGEDAQDILDVKIMQLFVSKFKGNIRKIDDYSQFLFEMSVVAENNMDNEPLEEQLKWYKPILVSPFVKSMKQNNKSR